MSDLERIDHRLTSIETEVRDTKKLVKWVYYMLGGVFVAAVILLTN